jgi:Fe-S-cluster containining protein
MDRKAPCRCGSGRQYKACCYPRDRAREQARNVAREGLAAVEGVLKVFLPLVESRGEHKIACHAGCSACCNNFVRASLAEGLLVADFLADRANAEVRARFEAKLPAWRERAGAEARELEQILQRNGGTPTEGPDWERYTALGMDYTRRANLCPFNEAGRCEVYPVRPTICRAVHVVETEKYCTPDQGGVPKVVSHPSLEGVVRDVTAQLGRAGFDLAGSSDERALPEAVAWGLAQR